ncbi:MAG: 50S ribosomal protein L17 [Chlamydiae bacterium]|nr:50S ribosomal protein L17 [Chlamydiota bacterium]
MRHRKSTFKLGRDSGHRKALLSNMLKALVEKESIETSVAKAKILKRHADKLITLAKKQTLAAKRSVKAKLKLRYNTLSSKEKRKAKSQNFSMYNVDRKIINKLFTELFERFKERNGGYTRILKLQTRRGDASQKCILQYLPHEVIPQEEPKKEKKEPKPKKEKKVKASEEEVEAEAKPEESKKAKAPKKEAEEVKKSKKVAPKEKSLSSEEQTLS